MEMAAPKPRFITIQQGAKEPSLQFVERVAAALEKQVEDDELRQILCRQPGTTQTKIAGELLFL